MYIDGTFLHRQLLISFTDPFKDLMSQVILQQIFIYTKLVKRNLHETVCCKCRSFNLRICYIERRKSWNVYVALIVDNWNVYIQWLKPWNVHIQLANCGMYTFHD